MEALWKAPLALLEFFGVIVLAAGIGVLLYLLNPEPMCHQSPQTQRIVCQPEPIRK